MPVVNPGIRRFLGSAIQRLFNSASFYAPLTHSLVPERGTGSPSFTRASEATFTDWEGVLRTVPSGCARFEGARMVRNLVATTSEDFSNAAWTKNVCSVTSSTESGPLGSTNATLITLGGGTTNKTIIYSATASAPAIQSFYFKAGTHKYIQLMNASDAEVFANFDLELGVVGTKGTKATSAIEDVGDGWYRVSALYNSTAILGPSWRVYFVSSASAVYAAATASTGTVYIWGAQLEDVTGQADQTASEYVSVGVLSDPWHGAGVDGVEFFNTDRDGAVIPAATNTGYLAEGARTNLCLQSQTIATAPWQVGVGISATADQYVAPDGTTTMDKLTALGGNTQHFWFQQITTTAATHTYSAYVRYVNNQWMTLGIFDGAGPYYCAFDILNGVVGSTLGPVTGAIEATEEAGVFRVSITATIAASVLSQIYFGVVNADDPSFGLWPAVGTEAIGVWGAQVELGSSASTYIATTTAAVTRAADQLTYPSAGNISGAVGAAYCEIKTGSVCGRSLSFNAGWTGMIDAGTGDSLSFRAYDETNVVNVTVGDSSASTVKQAIAWGGSTLSAARNGTTASGSFDGNMSPTGISIGGTTGGELNGTIRNVRIWNRQLSASEMQAITAP